MNLETTRLAKADTTSTTMRSEASALAQDMFLAPVILFVLIMLPWKKIKDITIFPEVRTQSVSLDEVFHDGQWWARQERSCLIEQGCITGHEVNHP